MLPVSFGGRAGGEGGGEAVVYQPQASGASQGWSRGAERDCFDWVYLYLEKGIDLLPVA